MDVVNAASRELQVTIAARVPPDLAQAVRALADAGDRTVSREIGRAIREHVQSENQESASAAASSFSAVRSSTPSERDEARSSPLAGTRPSLSGPDLPIRPPAK